MDNDGGNFRVQHGGAECILKAPDEYRLIVKGIKRPAKPPPLGAQSVPPTNRRSGDDENFEIRSMTVFASKCGWQYIRHGFFGLRLPLPRILTERSV